MVEGRIGQSPSTLEGGLCLALPRLHDYLPRSFSKSDLTQKSYRFFLRKVSGFFQKQSTEKFKGIEALIDEIELNSIRRGHRVS